MAFLFPIFCYASDSITVYLFLLDDCIICQSYTPKLKEMHSSFGDQYSFIGVFPNFSSKPQKIKKFVEDYNIPFETKTDYFKKLTKKFEIKVTPEVVVFNETTKEVIYKGRIDNEFMGLGKRRRIVTTDELRDVLESLSKGDKKLFNFTEAVGCFINQNDPLK